MSDITTRETAGEGATVVKGSSLTNSEIDANFINLNLTKAEKADLEALPDPVALSLVFGG